MTELEVINAMIRLESQSALNSADDDHPMVPTCKAIIREASHSLLSTGWWFNTWTVELHPDAYGALVVPDDTLGVQEVPNCSNTHLALVGDTLQDLSGRELTGPVKVRLIKDMPLTALPALAAEVVKAQARLTYAQDIIKDPTEAEVAMRQHQVAMVALRKEAIRQAQYNGRGNTYAWRMHRFYARNRANRGGY